MTTNAEPLKIVKPGSVVRITHSSDDDIPEINDLIGQEVTVRSVIHECDPHSNLLDFYIIEADGGWAFSFDEFVLVKE